jgi:DNA excision repair protein ERCC-3
MDAEDEGEGSFRDYSSSLTLKKDHRSRPLWVTADGLIILEAFSPIYLQAYDFLVAIAEPVSRPEFIHKYKLTPNSLYAAVAVSIETESIIEVLGRLCKTELPQSVVKFIRQCTSRSGKAKIVLKDNRYYVESSHPEVLRELLQYDTIANARAEELETSEDTSKAKGEFLTTSAPMEMRQNLEYMKLGRNMRDSDAGAVVEANEDDSDLDEDVIAGTMPGQTLRKVSFMIKQECVQAVKRCALRQAHYPLMEEYDFRHDTKNPSLPTFDLRPTTRIRSYQEKSLSKMFGNERARSGIIVLPCGAGKSLTGVTAACTIKKSTIILCINNVSVEQWKQQFLQWTTLTVTILRL